MNRYVYSLYDNELEEFSPVQSHISDDVFVTNLLINLHQLSVENNDYSSATSPVCIDFQNDSAVPNDAFLSRFTPFRVGIWDDETGILEPIAIVPLEDLFKERLDQIVDIVLKKLKEINEDAR